MFQKFPRNFTTTLHSQQKCRKTNSGFVKFLTNALNNQKLKFVSKFWKVSKFVHPDITSGEYIIEYISVTIQKDTCKSSACKTLQSNLSRFAELISKVTFEKRLQRETLSKSGKQNLLPLLLAPPELLLGTPRPLEGYHQPPQEVGGS